MEWKKPSELIAEAERRLIEGAKRIAKQCEIVSRLESIGGEAEQARKLLSQLIDAQQGQKLQLERLRAGRND
jgi:HPt (histidine-containing phosphotransfer) domain-containing protein